ncbi:pilus assembly protein TadE [Paenarthrobacter sp. CM16]|uniref:TadE family type IV pilus minor pilin n=1 Tax=Paenarthrobacter sp. CM16 TaxID=2738447 RepID=UPI00155338C7|nr:TadE family type IV pilus minor pilin [Paenarthrobacter sp. CM16]NQD88127.1 pilus assembly protein TadE [Paenarthrobacter sp. CM16]
MTHVLPAVGSPSAVLAGSPSCRKKDGAELGAVTAEFAVALPAVVLLLAFLLAGGAAGITQLRLQEAATAGARASARGETGATVEGIVRRLAGDTATSSMTDGGGWLTVTVSSRAGGAMGPLIPWTLTASASARAESGGASSAGAWSVGSGAGLP